MKSLEVDSTPKLFNVQVSKSNKISLYYSIYELSIDRFAAFESYILQDSEIGCCAADLNTKFQKLDLLLSHGKIEEAIQERINMHMGLFYGINAINIKHYAFACLVHSINDEVLTDYTESGLQETIKKLYALSIKEETTRAYLAEVKKNLLENLN